MLQVEFSGQLFRSLEDQDPQRNVYCVGTSHQGSRELCPEQLSQTELKQ